jgi:hypothetical protein
MSNRYTPYEVRRNRAQLQKTLLESFRLLPVTDFGAACIICLETYMMQSNNIREFLKPLNNSCTHMFCYKCIISMYSNLETTRSNVNCPMCRENITSWQAFFPNTSVNCKFTKKAAGNVPSTQQFTDVLNILKNRYAATPDDVESTNVEDHEALREQLHSMNEENKTLQEALNKSDLQDHLLKTENQELKTKISELEEDNQMLEWKTCSLVKKLKVLRERNFELEQKNCDKNNKNHELPGSSSSFENHELPGPSSSSKLQGFDLLEQINILKTQLFTAKENETKLLQNVVVLQSQEMELKSQNSEMQDKQQAYELIVEDMKQQLEEHGVSVNFI